MPQNRLKGSHFPKCIVLQAVYWYLRYALSYRDVEELMTERGVNVEHSSVQRWVVKYTEMLEKAFWKKKKAVGKSWRMDETYIKISRNILLIGSLILRQTGQTDLIKFFATEPKQVILKVADGIDWVLKTPAPKVVVVNFGESSVDLQLRVWIENARRRIDTISQVTDRVKAAFDAEKIEIPYPKRDIHIIK